MRAWATLLVVGAALSVACAGGGTQRASGGGASEGKARNAPSAARGRTPLERAQALLDSGRYAEALTAFRSPELAGDLRARVGLAEAALSTGDHVLSAEVASESAGAPADLAERLLLARGEALRRQGKHDEARAVLEKRASAPDARAVRLLLGEVLLESGLIREAEPLLLSLIEDYNAEKISPKDGPALAQVGRAAWLLGSPSDANDAFNESERAGAADAGTLLARAEVFLESHDPGRAEEVLGEVLARTPTHPVALARMAQVQLASNLDFGAAEALARKALAVNPRLTLAEAVLSGIALRDMDFDVAHLAIDRGLRTNPRDLELLSLRAAARFLEDDAAGFEEAKTAVLAKNPRYSRLYQIIGEYAEWEHRYEEIVVMMREALLSDPGDAKVRAQLGFNLIRSGEEKEGVTALARAFATDPMNVRVFNTLNLYEKSIPQDYVTVPGGLFTFRYHRDEKDLLGRYAPGLLGLAWKKFEKSYSFTPRTPVGVELYPTREHFAVRTSGLPQTFIQGVCFGRTLAAMSPRDERFNLGMTLWHELAHVFHIQLSRSRVPRWFTEGLAEYETLIERPEWRREHDAALAHALVTGRLPALGAMNRAFTRAEDMADMATAYYASTQVVAFMAGRFGMPRLREMLVLWGAGKRTPEVMKEALGVTVEEVDRDFRKDLEGRLSRYAGQFVPPSRPLELAVARRRVKEAPRDAGRHAALALSFLGEGNQRDAEGALRDALALHPREPTALWLTAQLARTGGDGARARTALRALADSGNDGPAVQLALAEVEDSPERRQAALEAAHALDPLAAAPLQGLWEMAVRKKDEAEERRVLERLVAIEENDGEAYRRLMTLLLRERRFADARLVGEAAVHADVESSETHRLYAEALLGTQARAEAMAALETAVLGRGKPEERALARLSLARLLDAKGDAARARELRKSAEQLVYVGPGGPI